MDGLYEGKELKPMGKAHLVRFTTVSDQSGFYLLLVIVCLLNFKYSYLEWQYTILYWSNKLSGHLILLGNSKLQELISCITALSLLYCRFQVCFDRLEPRTDSGSSNIACRDIQKADEFQKLLCLVIEPEKWVVNIKTHFTCFCFFAEKLHLFCQY